MKRFLLISMFVSGMIFGTATESSASIVMSAGEDFECLMFGCNGYNLSLSSDEGLISAISIDVRGDLGGNIENKLWFEESIIYCPMIYPPSACEYIRAADSKMMFSRGVDNLIVVAGSEEDSRRRIAAEFGGFEPFVDHGLAKIVPYDGQVSVMLSVIIDGHEYSSMNGDIIDGNPNDAIVLVTPGSWICGERQRHGDFNCDGIVNLLDLDILGRHGWSIPEPGFILPCDTNGDGECGLLDLDTLGMNWGELTPIPEPGVLGLLIIGGLLCVRRLV